MEDKNQPQAPDSVAPTDPNGLVDGTNAPDTAVPAAPVTPITPITPETMPADPTEPATDQDSVSASTDGPQVVMAPAHATPGRLRRKLLATLLVIIVLAGAGVGLFYALQKHHTQPVASKKDIPLIRYGMIAGTALPDPYPKSTDTNTASQLESQLFEGLVAYSNRSDIRPLLATGWTNPDSTHWVFTLRSGVHFHSGRPLTPQAVASSLNYAVTHQNDEDGSLMVTLASTIKNVSATGSNKVTITTDGPDPTLLNRLANLYIFDPQAPAGSADAGTGPYVLRPGSASQKNAIDLVAYDKYWGGHVYTRALHFSTVKDSAALTSGVLAGKYDAADEVNPSKALDAKTGLHVFKLEDLGPYFIGINTLKGTSPLHSLAARQAAAAALDVPAILKASGSAGTQASQLIPSAIPGYDPSLRPVAYDLTKAKQLLSSAPNAKTSITFAYSSNSADAATEIMQQLTAAGFTVVPDQISDIDTLVGTALSGKVDMYYLSYSSDTLDGLDILSTLLTGNKDYDNPQIDDLVQQAGTTLDPATRIKQLQKISQLVATDVPDIPLYDYTLSYVARSQYHLTADIPNAMLGAYFWKVYQ